MNNINSDEVSIEELYTRFKSYISDLWSFKYWIISITFIFSLFFGLKTYLKSDNYIAKVVFTVNENNQNQGMDAILGKFGIGDGVVSNYLKIQEIAFSNKIMFQLLGDSVMLNSNKDVISNHIIKELDIHNLWKEDTLLCDYYFKKGDSSSLKSYAFKQLVNFLKGDNRQFNDQKLLYFSFNEESTLMEISAHTEDPQLSVLIVEAWYNRIFDFYINTIIEKDKNIFDRLNQKADSIYSLIINSEKTFATEVDKLGVIKYIDRLEINHQSENLKLYGEMYSEVIKNKEMAEFMMNTKMPYFKIIDSPTLPLDSESDQFFKKILKYIIEGFILAIVFSSILSILKK